MMRIAPEALRQLVEAAEAAYPGECCGLLVGRQLPNGVIEAIRHTGDAWVAAVQWHPEFHFPELGVVDDTPLLEDFLAAARAARKP